jgi:hypothetical protein
MAGPRRHIDENPRRRVFEELARVDRVHGRELVDRGAVDIALQNLVERRSRGLQTKLHLFENELRLPLDRRIDDLAYCRVKWRKAAGNKEVKSSSRALT